MMGAPRTGVARRSAVVSSLDMTIGGMNIAGAAMPTRDGTT
jgi:hypothetical protein